MTDSWECPVSDSHCLALRVLMWDWDYNGEYTVKNIVTHNTTYLYITYHLYTCYFARAL